MPRHLQHNQELLNSWKRLMKLAYTTDPTPTGEAYDHALGVVNYSRSLIIYGFEHDQPDKLADRLQRYAGRTQAFTALRTISAQYTHEHIRDLASFCSYREHGQKLDEDRRKRRRTVARALRILYSRIEEDIRHHHTMGNGLRALLDEGS